MEKTKRFLALLLMTAMILSFISAMGISVIAVTETEQSDYFSNGPQADDLVAFMMSQVGTKTKDENGKKALCAGLVSAAARTAGMTSSQFNITATLASPYKASGCFGFLKSDGTILNESEIYTWKDFVDGRYKPIKGDFVFYGTINTASMTVKQFAAKYGTFTNLHIGVLRDNNSTTKNLYTVEGNTSYNGNSGYTNIKNRKMNASTGLAWTGSPNAYVTVFVRPKYEGATRGYLADCTQYQCSLNLTATAAANIRSLPSNGETLPVTETLGQAAKGSTFNSTSVWLNQEGEYWYEIIYNGERAFVYSGNVNAAANNNNNVTITNVTCPTGVRVKGQSLTLTGVIQSDLLEINKIGVNIYDINDTQRTNVLTGSVLTVNTYYYSIKSTSLDHNCKLGSLDFGDYIYVISVTTKNYTANNNTLKAVYDSFELFTSEFNVGISSDPAPSITSQPKSVTAAVGETASFSVETNVSGLSYEWQYSKNNGSSWKSCSVTKANLSVKASADNDGYLYRCIVSDSTGRADTSEPAKLTVIFEADDFKYTVNSDNSLTITSYTGSSTEVYVPQNINSNSVTGISDDSFSANLSSIVITENVTGIGDKAFSDCSDDLTIYGKAGSYAETYAAKTGIDFTALTEGWYKINDNWYYSDSTGSIKTGWQNIDDIWYYFGDGEAMLNGWQIIDGDWYYFTGGGSMQTGWQQIGSVWYYFTSNGKMLTGLQEINDKHYYFGTNGMMQIGWRKIDGSWYYFDPNGAMATGWERIEDNWYYFRENGEMETGWLSISGTYYYFIESGEMVTGWRCISGDYYYFYSSGGMATNHWIKYDGYWYYLKTNGKMAKSEKVTVSGKSYTFDSSGKCTNP